MSKISRILWGITSSGDLIGEIIEMMISIQARVECKVDLVLSKETPFMLKYYDMWKKIQSSFSTIFMEKGSNAPFLGGVIQRGKYDFLLVAPVTGNTMAKIAHGIADALIPNCIALGLKARIPTYLFPTDQEGIGEETVLVDGSILKLYPRPVDIENVNKVRDMEHVTVFKTLDEMHAFLNRELSH